MKVGRQMRGALRERVSSRSKTLARTAARGHGYHGNEVNISIQQPQGPGKAESQTSYEALNRPKVKLPSPAPPYSWFRHVVCRYVGIYPAVAHLQVPSFTSIIYVLPVPSQGTSGAQMQSIRINSNFLTSRRLIPVGVKEGLMIGLTEMGQSYPSVTLSRGSRQRMVQYSAK